MKKKYFLVTGLLSVSLVLSAQQELIENGSFESGEDGWDFTLSTDAYADLGSCEADDGDNYLWFGDAYDLTGLDDITDEVSQTVTLPSNLDYAEFYFSVSGTSDEQDDVEEFDFLYFGIFDENGDEIFLDSISNADLDPTLTAEDCDEWDRVLVFTLDSEYAGQDVTIGFAVETDAENPTIFRIDDVSLLALTSSAGIKENQISQIEISPNPANEQIKITNTGSSPLEVLIVNSVGEEMVSQQLKTGTTMIDISHLTSGVYLIKEQNGIVSKIVKQ
jgi:hypothetical protein